MPAVTLGGLAEAHAQPYAAESAGASETHEAAKQVKQVKQAKRLKRLKQ